MSDSPELRTVRKCTSRLETALKALDRDLVHFLGDEGFFPSDVYDEILNPRSMMTEAERAGELVKWIKNRVKQDPGSFHKLLYHFKQRGALYQPIAAKLSAEYHTIVTSTCPSQHAPEKREIASDFQTSQNPASLQEPNEVTPHPKIPTELVQTPQLPGTDQPVDSAGEYSRTQKV